MRKVSIKNREIQVGNQKIPFVSGEVHYWRLNPNSWSDVLDSVSAMGLKVISTYIPWDFHEYQKGKLDFTGKTDPARNLTAFLDLTKKKKLWVVIRPGPYIYSEWPNDGVPDHAYKYHRLHPQFLKLAKTYMKAVCKVIKPYFASKNSGNIILFQADNEIDPWPDNFGHQYGLTGKPGLFQEYLKKLYKNNLGRLNESWGTTYESFDHAGPFIATMLSGELGHPLKGDHELKRNLDFFRFKHDYSKQYAKWMVDTYREIGVDIPIYLNLYPFFYAHDWADLQSVCDLVGVDLYPTSELAEDKFEHRKFLDKNRYMRTVSKSPFIAEFESGVWHQRLAEAGYLTPNHYRLLGISALLGGVTGWNWYMLVNRDNWYMSPINEWGRERGDLYEAFKELVTIFHRLKPASLKKLTNVAVTFNPLQYAARTLAHDSTALVGLYEADADYETYDPRLGVCDKEVLFYSGNQWLDTKAQKNLRTYVEKGGTLVAFLDYPRKDENFKPSNLIGFEEPGRTLFEFKREFAIQFSKKSSAVKMISSVYVFDDASGEKIVADLGQHGKLPVGYIKKVGKGRIVHLGVKASKELCSELLNYLGVARPCYSTTADVKTALYQRGQKYYLMVTNNGTEDKSANICLPALQKLGKVKIRNLSTNETEERSAERRRPFTAEIPRKDGKVFELG